MERFFRMQTDTDLTIVGTTIDINQIVGDQPLLLNLLVYAEVAQLNGSLSLPGGNAIIHAREIIVNNEIKIDVSGIKGHDNNGPRSADGVYPGGSGTKGSDGGPGGNGGNVKLVAKEIRGKLTIITNGGDGGKGQDGGNGAKGATGGPGKDDDCSNGTGHSGGEGDPGFPGGNAGLGGTGGAGGNAGLIEVKVIVKPAADSLKLISNGGIGGKGGVPGQPGEGGDGGPGGRDSDYFPGTGCLRCDELQDDLIASQMYLGISLETISQEHKEKFLRACQFFCVSGATVKSHSV